MDKCVYTTIEYFPKVFTNESINVGFIFHNVTKGTIKFLKAKNKKRIISFDDELIFEDYIMLMDAFEDFIVEPFKTTLFGEKNVLLCHNEDYLNSIKNNFLNEFRFSNIMKINSNDPLKDFEEYSKIYLYFDYEKKERLKDDDISRILRRQLKQQLSNINANYEEKFSTVKIAGYGEPMKLDFKIGENIYVKVLDIRSDSFSKLNTAKIWAFNKQYFDNHNSILIFAITSKPESVEERAYYEILKATNAPIYTMNDLDQLVYSIQ